MNDHLARSTEPITREAALAQLVGFERERRVADALLQIEASISTPCSIGSAS